MSRQDFAAVMAFLLDHQEAERLIANNEDSDTCDIQDAEAQLKALDSLIDSAKGRFLEAEQGK